ncbi:MAG: pitrilysin family protein [candidate division Zixibacteria bacterium]|nr:pitrilysin family protein [candidate division Zixibacteria bacterium]
MRKLPNSLLLTLFALIIVIGTVSAQDEMQFKVNQFTLSNGMTFLVVERHTSPVFSGFITVAVGSAYEKTGNIGTAHLLEHMMFKGSQNIGTTNYRAEKSLMVKEDSVWTLIDAANRQTQFIRLNNPEKLGAHEKQIAALKAFLDSLSKLSSQYVLQNEFDRIYTRNGAAEFNANTGYDRTNYYVSLPANRIELWFAMESDRLKYPAFREFFPERDVISEERRGSVENSADRKMMEQLIGASFIAHPYRLYWEWQSEVLNLSREDLADFFKTYYIPKRITVAVVGDIKTKEVKRLAKKYFANIPSGKEPDPIYTEEPPQPGERRVEVVFESSPEVMIGYHAVAFDSPDQAPFEVIGRLLSDGRTSRLYKSLVLDQQLCLDISIGTFPGSDLGDNYPDLFYITAYPKEGVSTIDVEKGIYAELDKLATTPVDEKELTKIKNRIDAEFVWGFYFNLGLADKLAVAQNMAQDWHYLWKYRTDLKVITPGKIMEVAKKYFTKENRTVATLIPKETGGAQ